MKGILRDAATFAHDVFWQWQSWAGGSGMGGAVLVLLALYERFADHTVSKRAYAYVLLLGFVAGAVFMAWRAQRHARFIAEERISRERAHFELEYSGIEKVVLDSTAQPFDPASVNGSPFMIRVVVKNDGTHYARNIVARLLVTSRTLTEPPSINVTVDNGPNETKVNVIRAPVTIGADVPQQFVAYEIEYDDAETAEHRRQAWYWFWLGSSGGYFNGDFANASTPDTVRLIPYLRQHGWNS